MPIYEYKCDKCGKISEILQKHFDVDEAPCEACGAPAHRIMSNTSFVLKGSGWYVTDYKANGGCSASGGNEAKHEAGSADAGSADKSSGSSCDKAATGGCGSCSGSSSSSASSSSSSASVAS